MASNGKSGNMLSGLKDRSPSASDSSTKPPSGDVNSEATRKEVAPQQATLGPRTA
jgi:hypothetical protein